MLYFHYLTYTENFSCCLSTFFFFFLRLIVENVSSAVHFIVFFSVRKCLALCIVFCHRGIVRNVLSVLLYVWYLWLN